MAIRRLRWHGPARAAACADAVQARVAQWLADWSATPVADVAFAATPAPPPADAGGWSRGDARVWLGVADAAALGARLAGLPAADAAGLAERLAARALADLGARLLPSSASPAQPLPAPSADDLAPRHGALAFVATALHGLHVVLDLAAAEALSPPDAVARPALTPRLSALGAEPLACEMVLDLGAVALADASALAVGEVLLAGPLRDSVVQVRSNGNPILRGALSRHGERLALAVQNRLS